MLSYGINQFESVRGHSRSIVEENNIKSELIVAMLSSARERVLDLSTMISSDDPFVRDEIFLHFNKQGAIFARARLALVKHKLSEDEKKILKQQGDLTRISLPIQLSLIDLIQRDDIAKAKKVLNSVGVEAQNKVLLKLAELLKFQQTKSHALLGEIDSDFENSRRLIVGWSIVLFLGGAIVASFVIYRSARIEKKLFFEMEKARATLSSISDILFRIDTKGIIIFSNEMTKKLFNDDLIGKNIFEILTFSTKAKKFDNDETQANKLGRYNIEINDVQYWFEVSIDNINNEAGDITGMVLVLHDITEIIDAQNELEEINATLETRIAERTKKLELSNVELKESIDSLAEAQEQLVHSEKMASLGGLVAGISHEINTPIGIGVTSATNIEEKMGDLEKLFLSGELTKSDFEAYVAQTNKGLKILISNLKRASDLIRSFKQVAVDQSSDELREIELHDYCEEIILSLHPKLKSTSIKVLNEVDDNILIFTHPGAIYQILSNLIVNTIVHAFDESTSVSQPEIHIKAKMLENTVSLEYLDNGSGVSQDSLSKIFEPFYTTKRGQGGSGLGMNLVYNLVTTTLNGKVSAQSEAGKGLHLLIQFPILREGRLNASQ